VSLERAGCLLVRSDPAADQTPFVDLISSQGTASRFFLYKTERRAWCPAGPYTVRTADSSHPVDIPSGMTIPFMLR